MEDQVPREQIEDCAPHIRALDIVSEYTAALASRDSQHMQKCRSQDFVLDFVHRDAIAGQALSGEDTDAFWPAWFASFPEMDYRVVRTIAADTVVACEWIFTGTNSGPLAPPVFAEEMEPTGKTIRLRGVTVFEVEDCLIRKESTYMDLSTLMVELEVPV